MIAMFSGVLATIVGVADAVMGKSQERRIEEQERMLIEISGSPACLPRHMQEKYFPEWLSRQRVVRDEDLLKDYLGERINGNTSPDGSEES